MSNHVVTIKPKNQIGVVMSCLWLFICMHATYRYWLNTRTNRLSAKKNHRINYIVFQAGMHHLDSSGPKLKTAVIPSQQPFEQYQCRQPCVYLLAKKCQIQVHDLEK